MAHCAVAFAPAGPTSGQNRGGALRLSIIYMRYKLSSLIQIGEENILTTAELDGLDIAELSWCFNNH